MGSITDAQGNALVDGTGLVSSAVKSVLASRINSSGQTLTGVAGPPLGRTGTGGQVAINTITFTLTRAANVELVGLVHGLVNTSSGPQDSQAPMNFFIDGVLDTQNMSLPDYPPAAAGQYNGTAVLLLVKNLAAGGHSVSVVWNSEQAANDTLHDYFDAVYAFQLGS